MDCKAELKKQVALSQNPMVALQIQKMCFDWSQEDLEFLRAHVADVRGTYGLVQVHKTVLTTAIVATPGVLHDSGPDGELTRKLGHRVYDLDTQRYIWIQLAELKADLVRVAAKVPSPLEDEWSFVPMNCGLDFLIDNANNFSTTRPC